MRKFIILMLLLVVSVSVAAQDGGFPRTVTDGLGVEVTIESPPQRIISLTLSNDAILLDLIAPERILGITALSTDPGISNIAARADVIENKIASASDVEQVISLEPDLVFVASFTAPEVVQQYRDVGLTVFSTASPSGFDAIQDNIRLVGEVVGAEDQAEALVAQMDSEIAAVSEAVSDRAETLRALYLTPNNYTSGVDSSISEIIAAAGGIDVAAEAGIDQYAPVSDEFIIEQDPDAILLTGWTPYDPTFLDTFANNPAFADLTAVQNGRIYTTLDAHVSTVSHHISEGVKDVAAYLYPDLYPAYPITLTDAAGNVVTIEDRPNAVAATDEYGDILFPLLDGMEDRGFDLMITDMGDSINSDGNMLMFIPPVGDDELPEANADSVTHVRLYEGDSPGAVVANTLIMGAALNRRVAALGWVAGYTDEIEAQAAE